MSTEIPLVRAMPQPLMLELFLPFHNGRGTPSAAPSGTDWRFNNNTRLTARAEELGLNQAFGLTQWLGAQRHGRDTQYQKYSLDPLLVTAGSAAGILIS